MIEIAYRKPGSTWKRRKLRTEREAERFCEALIEDAAEIRWVTKNDDRFDDTVWNCETNYDEPRVQ